MKINSKEYWDRRFDTDWLEYAGDKQTAFFAELLCKMLPDTLVKEIMSKEYTVCDMGCALGEGIPIFSKKLGVDVAGMDFSSEAIEKAKQLWPGHEFWVGDLNNLSEEKKYDVVICSNVLEHFYNPWKILEKIARVAQKYMIVMVPYKEELQIEEHEYHFSEEVIPVKLAGYMLDYVRTLDGKEYPDTYYPDQQILMIFKKEEEIELQMLSEITAGTEAAVRREFKKKFFEQDQIIEEKGEEIARLEAQIKELQQIHQEHIAIAANRELDVKRLEQERLLLDGKIQGAERAIENAKRVCYQINSKTSYKLACAFMRFIRQFIMGSLEEKKKFIGICKRSITRERSEFTGNDGYNMILNVANLLEVPVISEIRASKDVPADNTEQISEYSLGYRTAACLKQLYNKPDILMFSVINYDFRHQRPQHFAQRFAENGHRVFYINANFVNPENVKETAPNLFTVDFFAEKYKAIYFAPEWEDYFAWFKEKMDHLIQEYAVRDAVIVLDYPNWIYGAEYLREKYGFKIVVDYMDDFTGFLGTTTNVLKDNCVHMLESSDLVVASSQFLSDIAKKYAEKSVIVRNGTEVEHFYQAVKLEEHRKRPVIGYYGAVSHWFAWEKVCYLAKNMPECDIVIIGEITDHRKQLEKYSNIKLLGEMSYRDLPEHLAYFDVCLIPFDTSTDLIKATNPVKFYEYLSAGKRIVATEIPELEPYRNEFVYMSNDDQQFLQYVRLCLEGKDTLKSREECIAFAKESDWQKRYETFAEACLETVPKVSIIVLTYNNLELNKVCINSILTKTAYPNYELIVVDNKSTDGTAEYLQNLEKERNPKLKIILNEDNKGFAGGNNQAAAIAEGKYIMLLNNDTVVTRGWLTNAVKHMENDPSCGMCGAVTNSIGNEAMIAVKYRNMEELQEFAYDYTMRHNNEIYTDVDRLAMFCTLIRRDILDQYGLLDENYQVGMFEDDDYAKGVEKAGYQFYITEDVFVHHVNNASFKKIQSDEYKKIFQRNKEYFEKKWGVKWKMPKYRDGVNADINREMMVEPR